MNFRSESAARRRWVAIALDVTPLIDVIFLLLVFFFYSVQVSEQKNRPISVNLPRASAKPAKSTSQDREITISKDGKIFLDRAQVDLPTLKKQLTKIKDQNPKTRLLIRSDSAAQVGRLIDVMNLAKKLGLKKIGIATKAEKQ